LTKEQKERGEYKIGEGFIGEVVRAGKPYIIPKSKNYFKDRQYLV
jgi:hypothetical protein